MVTKLCEITREEGLNLYVNNGGEWFGSYFSKLREYNNSISDKQYLEESQKLGDLCGDHKNKIKNLFGKQNFCYTTWYKGWVWFVDYKGLIISISSSIRGTDYRYYNLNEDNDEEIYEKMKGFVGELYSRLNNNDEM